MKLAFVIYTFFPSGGLTKDLSAIARACKSAGHKVRIYAESCRGAMPEDLDFVICPVKAVTHHRRNRLFFSKLPQLLGTFEPDLIIGFNKMPELDVYFSRDSCFKERVEQQQSWWYRMLPRNRHFMQYERAVFGSQYKTEVIAIDGEDQSIYRKHYGTQEQRFHYLPPGISRDSIAPADIMERRNAWRRHWQLPQDHKVLLMVGYGFRNKGLDRALLAVAMLPAGLKRRTHLLVIGADNANPYLDQARNLGIGDQVQFLSNRDDVPSFLWGADLLIHLAKRPIKGVIILEALVAGLPVVSTDVCCFSHYISEMDMGKVLPARFEQSALNSCLESLLTDYDRYECWQRGRSFAEQADIYSMPQRAVQCIESFRPAPN